MNETLIWSLENARRQTFNLIEDLRGEQMCAQTAAGENHPLWTLGHLLLGDTYLLSMLEVRALSDDFFELLSKYGPHSKPISDFEVYDSKSVLAEKLTETGARRVEAVRRTEDLTAPLPDETLARTQATLGHHLHMLVFHEGHHCGQIAAWRKAHGFPAVKGIFAS